ncbi:CbtB domain-containing protein [Oceaniglobus trochenteri]|uniref:CbtB domain-containing protein n=1 Tax=Oceaniglobus trochenteri TaxID=2763260 RepID=UPI001CFFDA5B|nr:CbtB domain-containing protein [Oceaniglobus trochenteri]
MTTQTQTLPRVQSTSPAAIVFAVIAGVLLIGASGLAQASIMHDAAHDQRHAMAFPCH